MSINKIMFYDADTHWNPPFDYFKDLPSVLVKRIKSITVSADLDARWATLYNDIKDASWPDCGTVKDFHLLPEAIRAEIKNNYNLPLVYIAPDLSWLHLDSPDNHYPDFDTFQKSMTYLVRADRQLLNPNWTNYRLLYSESPSLAVPLMKAYNHAISEVCGPDSNCDGNMWLALQDFDASMEELEKNIDKNFFGIVLTGCVNWPFIEQFRPLFEKCASGKIPVTFHIFNNEQPPLEFVVDSQNPHYQILRKHYAFTDQTHSFALAGFIASGMLDQLPDLRIIIPEVTAKNVEGIRRTLIDLGYPDPLPYFKKNFWFTVDIEEAGLFDIANEYGWDRFLFATDYPHCHDVGGSNRFKDVDMINELLQQGRLSQENYNLLTYKNYDFLKNRK